MKIQSNVTYANFQQKKSEKSIYNACYDKWRKIKRACNPDKNIACEAIMFIAAIEFLFTKNHDEVIFNSKLLKEKCNQGDRQIRRFLKQLADLYDINNHTSYNYKGKKYYFVYSVKRTEKSLEILENPELFYTYNIRPNTDNITVKNVLDSGQKCPPSRSKMSATYIVYRNTIETNIDDLSDLSKIDEKKCEEIIEEKDQKYQFENIKNEAEEEPSDQYKNTLLKNFKPTNEIFDKVRELSNKPHFTNDRIIALMKTIVAKRPETQVFGKAQAFINYLVKAINNENEYTKQEKLPSVEERNQKQLDDLLSLMINKTSQPL